MTEAVHAKGGKIAMQILHSGRYGYHPWLVSPSAIKAPIGWFKPDPLSSSAVEKTIEDYAKSAALAKKAGYDGVEIMGSEGYLINQFIASRTNKRNDEWGGDYANRIEFPRRIVKAVRLFFLFSFRHKITYVLHRYVKLRVRILSLCIDCPCWILWTTVPIGLKLRNLLKRWNRQVRRLLILESDGMRHVFPQLQHQFPELHFHL